MGAKTPQVVISQLDLTRAVEGFTESVLLVMADPDESFD